MSEPNDDLLKALADLVQAGEDSAAATGSPGKAADKPASEPSTEDFLERLAACERAVNA